jgi:hypothetical protein
MVLQSKFISLPMSYSSTSTSSFYNNGMKGEVLGSRLIGCVCNLSIIIIRPNFKLHPLSLVKVQFSPLSFDRFNLVL